MYAEEIIVKRLKLVYPEGTRIELIKTDRPEELPIGTRGTVHSVEEKGGLIIDWDNCCNQHIIRGIDKVKKIVR